VFGFLVAFSSLKGKTIALIKSMTDSKNLIMGLFIAMVFQIHALPVTVMVSPLENLSGVKAMTDYEIQTGTGSEASKRVQVDRYSEVPRGYIEDILLKQRGIKVVERKRVDSLLLESEFSRLKGFVDQEQVSKLGAMLGAQYIVMGSILSLDEEERKFSGYNVTTRIFQIKCEIRVRIIEVKSGSIVFATTVSSDKKSSSQLSQSVSQASVFQLIKSAILKINDNTSFKEAIVLMTKPVDGDMKEKEVEIKINPVPTNCDVEIDGQFIGNSPLILKVEKNKKIVIKISKQGYQHWEKAAKVNDDLQVTPELQSVKIIPETHDDN